MTVLQNLDFAKAWKELLPKLLGEALQIVLIVTIVSFLLAIVFGFILTLGRLSKHGIINKIVTGDHSGYPASGTAGLYLLCISTVN